MAPGTIAKRKAAKAKERTAFTQKVISLIRQIPYGKVASYGQIAKLAGQPNASRGVVWILHSTSKKEKLPWHRVINSRGQISFPIGSGDFKIQKKLLLAEGAEFISLSTVNLVESHWKKQPRKAKPKAGQPRMFC